MVITVLTAVGVIVTDSRPTVTEPVAVTRALQPADAGTALTSPATDRAAATGRNQRAMRTEAG